MRMQTMYLVTTETTEALDKIMESWGDVDGKENDFSFESYAGEVFDVMEKVIKLVHQMETTNEKHSFSIVGKCETDYDCFVLSIEYNGTEPMIKASQADPEENEGRFYLFCYADYDEIPKLLKRNNNRTFKQAVKDDLPLSGFLPCSYDEWYKSILSK